MARGVTTALTLAAFLEARLAEDEAEALAVERDVTAEFGHAMSVLSSALAAAGSGYMEYPVLTIDPTRVLAEVAAKRRLVELWSQWDALCSPDDWPDGEMSGAALADAGRWMLRVAATVYADHENYDPSWAVS